MKVVGYGMKGFEIWISDTCNKLASKYWLMVYQTSISPRECEGCVLGKHPQEKFDKGKSQWASEPLDLIHSDLMGPFLHPSINKMRFFLIFVDDFSRFTWIYFLKQKSEVFQHLKDFKALVETQSGKKIKVLQTNNGGEYVNHEIHNLFHEAGIQLQHTVPYTLQ